MTCRKRFAPIAAHIAATATMLFAACTALPKEQPQNCLLYREDVLADQKATLAEPFGAFTFTRFNGEKVTV